jgi:hypothetical protein
MESDCTTKEDESLVKSIVAVKRQKRKPARILTLYSSAE